MTKYIKALQRLAFHEPKFEDTVIGQSLSDWNTATQSINPSFQVLTYIGYLEVPIGLQSLNKSPDSSSKF